MTMIINPDPTHAIDCPNDGDLEAARRPGDTIPSFWRCPCCDAEVEFDDADYAFVNSFPYWGVPRPALRYI